MIHKIKNLLRISTLLLLLALVLPRSVYAANEEDKEKALAAASGMMALTGYEAGTLLSDTEAFPPGSSICDWTALGFSRLGLEEDYDTYRAALEEYVSEKLGNPNPLHMPLATEWQRAALTVLAVGGDPRSFGKDVSGKPLDLVAQGIWDYAGETPGEQGLNGWIFALIAMDAGDYEPPKGAVWGREAILDKILAAQEDDGGFGLLSEGSNVDITAMALQALAPYQDREPVCEAVERALSWLSKKQTEEGDFIYYDEPTSESASQVIIALCSLGVDPEADERFQKPGGSVIDSLERFVRLDGSYAHTMKESVGDPMATEQAMLAWTAVWMLRSDRGRLYHFEEIMTSQNSAFIYVGLAFMVLVILLGTWMVVKRRKKHE